MRAQTPAEREELVQCDWDKTVALMETEPGKCRMQPGCKWPRGHLGLCHAPKQMALPGPHYPGESRERAERRREDAATAAHKRAVDEQRARLIVCYGHVPAVDRDHGEWWLTVESNAPHPVSQKAINAHAYGCGWRKWGGKKSRARRAGR